MDALNYIIFTNPISATTGYYAKAAASAVVNYSGLAPKAYQMVAPEPLWKTAATTGSWVRLAALSGATAVVLGAIGAHRQFPQPQDKSIDRRQIFETANRYHFFHSLTLLGLPLCRKPALAGFFFVTGMSLFCGTCYYYAFTGNKGLSRFTPVGGSCLILGWLAMCI